MNIEFPSNATAKKILSANKPPRGATHFRFSGGERRAVIDKIANIDTLAGCSGVLEYGKVTFEGRGRHAQVKEFIPLTPSPSEAPTSTPRPTSVAAAATPAPEPSKGRKIKILGFSACAVAKRL